MSGLAAEKVRLDTGVESIDWMEEACSLEDQLLQQARRTPNGEVIWLHPSSFREGMRRPICLGSHLYNGITGVALFLAAMEYIEPREGRRECILSALAGLRRQLAEQVDLPGTARDPFDRIGGFSGLGGFIYGFALIGRWLGEPELLAEAAEIATLITPDRIATDDALDVMSGCAGAALALLALDQVSPGSVRSKTPLERAIACGEHLLTRRVATESGYRAWPVNSRAPRFGFAHGAAGIACSLARLFERTAEARFQEAAAEGVAFEHLHYDSVHGDWPLLGQSRLRFMNSWCNGAPGIALGRLGMLALGDIEPIRQDLQAALVTTQAPANRMSDSLCCGSMGRVESLLRAYEILGNECLLQAAEEIASQVVLRNRDRDGLYPWLNPGSGHYAPSFFRGAAGAAYTFLRLARPPVLPCILSMEIGS